MYGCRCKRRNEDRPRRLWCEILENRRLLSVSPLSNDIAFQDPEAPFQDGDFAEQMIQSPGLDCSALLGGSGDERGLSIVADSAGNVLLAGWTNSADIPASGNLDATYNGGNRDAYVAKLTSSGELLWATYLGGAGGDRAWGIGTDEEGNVFVTGETTSTNFPTRGTTSGGIFQGGRKDGFVTKLSPSGELIWSRFLGGNGGDAGFGLSVDASGNVTITGETTSSDLATAAVFDSTHNGGYDAFIARLTKAGDVSWASYLGGSSADWAYKNAVDSGGNIILTGYTSSTNLPTPGGFDTCYGGGSYDAFVAKVTPSGQLAWASYLGGSDYDGAWGVAVDSANDAFIAGRTYSVDLPAANGHDTTLNGGPDAFVAKVHSEGRLEWTSYLGGSGDDMGYGMAVDTADNAWISGRTSSADFPVLDSFGDEYGGGVDAFLAAFTPSGEQAWSNYLGSADDEIAIDVSTGPAGDVLISGYTTSSDFPAPISGDPHSGSDDLFVTRLGRLNEPIDLAMLSGTTADSQGVTFEYEVRDSATGQFYVGVYRSADSEFDPSEDAFLGGTVFANVDPGYYSAALDVSLPVDAEKPYVLIVADPPFPGSPDGQVDETNESNNIACFRKHVIGVVTHGLCLDGEAPTWPSTMAAALGDRGYREIIELNWSRVSNLPIPELVTIVGRKLAKSVLDAVDELSIGDTDIVDMHWIGHSRGAGVISTALTILNLSSQIGILPDALDKGFLQMTLLDPHPARDHSPPLFSADWSTRAGRLAASAVIAFERLAKDPPIVVPEIVDQAEGYYQHTDHSVTPEGSIERILNLWGEDKIPGVSMCEVDEPAVGHSEIVHWYLKHRISDQFGAVTTDGSGYGAIAVNQGAAFSGNERSYERSLFSSRHREGVEGLDLRFVGNRRVHASMLQQLSATRAAYKHRNPLIPQGDLTAFLSDFEAKRGMLFRLEAAGFFGAMADLPLSSLGFTPSLPARSIADFGPLHQLAGAGWMETKLQGFNEPRSEKTIDLIYADHEGGNKDFEPGGHLPKIAAARRGSGHKAGRAPVISVREERRAMLNAIWGQEESLGVLYSPAAIGWWPSCRKPESTFSS
jgi:hypothetical protein